MSVDPAVDFRRTARRVLRDTPEYEQARKEGRAREWLDREADSAAYMLYMTMVTRVENLDP